MMEYIHQGLLFSHKNQGDLALCDNIRGPQGPYVN